MIDGKVYKEISEERTEMNAQGQQIRRIYIKYIPVDETPQQFAAPNTTTGYTPYQGQPQGGYNQGAYQGA